MTPTESAAVAALYALVISVVLYRSVSGQGLYTALLGSGRQMASVGILIAGALVFNYVVTKEEVPQTVKVFLQGFDLSAMGFLLLVNLLLLALGALLEGGTILLVIVPILIPTAQALGIDVPMATALIDAAAARRDYLEETGGRYVHLIAYGDTYTGGRSWRVAPSARWDSTAPNTTGRGSSGTSGRCCNSHSSCR